MKDKKKWVLTAGIFLLLCMFMIPPIHGSAATFSLVKKAGQRIAPEGELVKTSKGRRYYRYDTGKYLKNCWVSINGKIYHFNKKGYADKGWITVRGKKYFLRANGQLHKGGFLRIKGKKYFFKYGYGMMMTGWRKISKNYYYFMEEGDAIGAMVTSQWVGEKYVGSNGKMLKDTWIDGYYVGSDGVRVKNAWVDEKYLGADGSIVTNAWQDGVYLDATGAITKNAWVGDQYVGEDGKVTDPSVVALEKKRIFVGDSRTVGMYQIITSDTLVKAVSTQSVETQLARERTDIYIGKVGMGYDWLMGEAIGELRTVMARYPQSQIILRMGVNDLGNIDNYIQLYKNLMQEFPNAEFFIESVTPINLKLAKANGYSITNGMIKTFNKKLKAAFPENYLDSYTYLIENNGKTVDGVHYTRATYEMIFEFLDLSCKGELVQQ